MKKELERKGEALLGDLLNFKQLFFDRNTSKNSEEKKTVLSDVVDNFKLLVTDNKFIIPLIIFIVLGYGFAFFFNGIHNDDLDSWRFFYPQHVMIGHGRITPSLINGILNNYHYNRFFLFFSATILLAIGAILNASLVKAIVKINNHFFLALATVLLVIFPIMYYIQIFLLATFTIGICTILTVFANIYIIDYIKCKKRMSLALAFIFLVFVMSAYEQYMIIFLTVCLFTVIFSMTSISKFTYSKDDLKIYIFSSLIIFIFSIVVEQFLGTAVQFIMGIEDLGYLENRIVWFDGNFSLTLRTLIIQIFGRFVIIATQSGAWFFFWVLIIAFLSFGTNKDNIVYKFLIILSLFTFSIVFGQVQWHRMSLGFAYFAMFALIYVYILFEKKLTIKYIIISVSILWCFYSAQEIHTAFESSYIKSRHEQYILRNVGNDIRYHFGRQSNVFLGGYVVLPKSIAQQPLETRRDSFQGRAIMALGRVLNLEGFANFGGDVIFSHYFFFPYTFVLRDHPILKLNLLNHVGNDFNSCGVSREFAQQILDDMSIYPDEGYVIEVDGCVFVRLN